VVNFDNGTAGQAFLQAFHSTPPGNQSLNWIFDQSLSSSSEIVNRIENGKAWGAVYMNPQTTDRINQLVHSIQIGQVSNSSYLPASATMIVYDQGRSFATVSGYVLPPIRTAIAVASARYSAYIQSEIAQNSNTTIDQIVAAITLSNSIYSPIGYTEQNLHPAVPYASLLATSLGYLFFWLVMLSLVGMNVRITASLAGKIRIIDIVFIRLFSAIFNCLIISLIYSLIVLWLANFTRAIPFIRFWLFNWLVAITFSAIIALFVLNLGTLAQVALTLFLITNLASSTANIAIELQHRFYRIGYGLPLMHCFTAGRHFLFGSHTKLHVDIGVLFAFYFAAAILAILTGIIRMRRQEKLVLEKVKKTTKK